MNLIIVDCHEQFVGRSKMFVLMMEKTCRLMFEGKRNNCISKWINDPFFDFPSFDYSAFVRNLNCDHSS